VYVVINEQTLLRPNKMVKRRGKGTAISLKIEICEIPVISFSFNSWEFFRHAIKTFFLLRVSCGGATKLN
jgi:hypothetical protein